MKKLINIAAVLLAASMIFVGCSNGVAAPGSNNGGSGSGNEAGGSAGGSGSGNDPVVVTCDVASITLENNFEYNSDKYVNQQQIVDCLQSVQFAVGDVVEVEVKGSITSGLKAPISIDLVDNTPEASWWCNIAGTNAGKEILAAGDTAIDAKVTFNIETASTAKGAAKLQVMCNEEKDSNPVITITSLKFTIK